MYVYECCVHTYVCHLKYIHVGLLILNFLLKNFGRFFRFYFVMELNKPGKIVLLPIPTSASLGDFNRPMGDGLWSLNGF